MIIKEYSWRKLLGLPWVSIQGEWLDELNFRIPYNTGVYDPSKWTGIVVEYGWLPEIENWLIATISDFQLGKCHEVMDFGRGKQAKIWFRKKSDAVMFKLVHGGKTPSMTPTVPFRVVRTHVRAKSRKLKATWTP